MIMFMNGDDKRRMNGNYTLLPFIERCNGFDLATLAGRMQLHFSSTVKLLVNINLNFFALALKFMMVYNVCGIATSFALKRPILIIQPTHHLIIPVSHSITLLSSLFIDPTISGLEMKKKLCNLPDNAFGPWSQFKQSMQFDVI